MKSRWAWRVGRLAMLIAAPLMAPQIKQMPCPAVQNPAALYLLAEYKLAAGDTAAGLELLDRALTARQPAVPAPKGLSACNISVTAAIQ